MYTALLSYKKKALVTNVDPEENVSSFKLLPNPAQDYIRFQFNSPSQIHHIQLLNITGNLLNHVSISDQDHISVKNLSPGLYIIRHIESGHSLIWTKL